ncbi:glycerol acyltransferase, partial [Acinetobacter variabilis]
IIPFAALGGDEIFEIGFDARQVVEHKYFQKLLKVSALNKLLRKGDVIPSLPKSLFPKRLPFYFQFQPALSVSHIQSQEDMTLFRDQIQQQIYQAIEELKNIRASELSPKS